MTTYFTPVGTLTQGSRVNASDLNSRESAITTGFTGIEAVVAPTDGAASITYGTNWAALGGQMMLRKQLGTMIVLNAAVIASASPGTSQLTLPSGYRPSVSQIQCVGMYFDASAVGYFPATVTVTNAGVVTITGYNAGSAITSAVSDVAYCNITYYTT